MNTTIGTCSRCGGRVSVPMAWWGIYPPTPECESCGAVQKNAHGPVVETEPRRSVTVTGATTGRMRSLWVLES